MAQHFEAKAFARSSAIEFARSKPSVLLILARIYWALTRSASRKTARAKTSITQRCKMQTSNSLVVSNQTRSNQTRREIPRPREHPAPKPLQVTWTHSSKVNESIQQCNITKQLQTTPITHPLIKMCYTFEVPDNAWIAYIIYVSTSKRIVVSIKIPEVSSINFHSKLNRSRPGDPLCWQLKLYIFIYIGELNHW